MFEKLPRFPLSFFELFLLRSAFLEFTRFDSHFTVDKTCLPELVVELNKPTSTYIHVADRKTIGSLLRTIQVHYKTCR